MKLKNLLASRIILVHDDRLSAQTEEAQKLEVWQKNQSLGDLMSNLSVYSEIGRLRAVAVHRPGKEVDYMTPSLMHQLLFDDILFGKEARQEHDIFTQVLETVTDRVVDVQDLLAEALAIPDAKTHFLARFTGLHHLSSQDKEELTALPVEDLAELAISGWCEETNDGAQYRFRFPPVPNLLFMRDPAAVIGSGVSINNMATDARKPEPFLMETIFRFHPEFRITSREEECFNAIPSILAGHSETQYTIEGGDILVLSENAVAVGVSIRTAQSAIIMLAEKLRKLGHFKTLYAVLMPHERAVMHLDTIFTRINYDQCLVFPPFFKPGNQHVLPTIKMDLGQKNLQILLKDNFLDALEEDGIKLEPVFCGGTGRLHQEREQWTDGANAFCLAPGVILGYSRNTYTAEELDKVGFNILSAEQVLKEPINLLDGKKYFVSIRGNELSRARGGPRCMTMPLRREPA